MNNNMIRKSVAVLSSALLTGAALVGFAAPAQAAGEVKLEADAGVGYSVPHKTTFGLKTSITAGNDSDELQYLHYTITTSGGVEVYVNQDDTATEATASDTLLVWTTETKDTINYGTGATGWDEGELAAYLAVYIENSSSNAFAFTDSDVSVTVTAFIDKDDDNTADSDEWQATQTIKWIDNANYDLVNVLKTPSIGDTVLTGTITSATMNLAQADEDTHFDVDFTPVGSAAGEIDSATDDVDPTYDADNNELDYTTGASALDDGVVTAKTYAAALELSDNTAIATSSRRLAATDAANLDVTVAAGANNSSMAASGATSDDFEIREGDGSFTIKAVVEDSSGDPVTGETVTLTIKEDSVNALSSTASYSIGGKTLTNADATDVEEIEVTAVSSSPKGEVEFTVSYANLDETDGDIVDITLDVNGVNDLENASNTDLDTDVLTATPKAATASLLFSADVQQDDEDLVFATDEAFTLTYHVLDQFGVLSTESGLSVVVTESADSYTASVVNGVAKVQMPGFDADNDGALSLAADVIKVGTDPTVTAFSHTVFVGTEDAVATIDLAGTFGTASSKTALNTEETANADIRFSQTTDAPDNQIADFTATLRDVNGNATRGQVTLSSPNLIFEADTYNTTYQVFKKGSITMWADDSGVVNVDISSQVAGTQTLTVTSQGVSVTKDIVFADAAETAGANLTVSVADYVAAGSTATVIATLTDKFGNPVKTSTSTDQISMTYTGPGLVYPSTAPVKTDKNGQAKISVLLGSSDTGSGEIEVLYDQGSDGDFTGVLAGDLDLSATDTFTIGTAPAAKKVNAGSFKGYVAVYAKGYEGQRLSAKIGADWVIVDPIVNNQENGTLHRTVDFTGAGVDITVRIYIDRVLTATIPLTTK